MPIFQKEITGNKQWKFNMSHSENVYVEKLKQRVGTEVDLGQGEMCCFLESDLGGPSAQGRFGQKLQASLGRERS